MSDRLWIFLILILLGLPATAWASDKPYIQAYERVTFKWKGNYAHNSAKTFSRENKYLSGWSRNFMNGAPEEGHKVQKDGELRGLLFMPKAVSEPIPFIVLMHPCGGFKWHLNWVETTAAKFVEAGYGVIAPDSYTTRDIRMNCATDMGLHWGFRRGEDAYSALDYVIERKLAIPNKVYLVGYSNGGLATLVAMSNKMKAHPNKFNSSPSRGPITASCLTAQPGLGIRGFSTATTPEQQSLPSKRSCRRSRRVASPKVRSLITKKDAAARTMTEVLFYHLQDTTLERVLPPLLEKSLARGWRVAVQTGSEERAEAIDAHLWTWREDSFLPHGTWRDADAAELPVVLVVDEANPNRADVRFIVDSAGLPADCDSYARVVMVFNGDDDEALGVARAAWSDGKARGFEITYWQTDERGRWHQRA